MQPNLSTKKAKTIMKQPIKKPAAEQPQIVVRDEHVLVVPTEKLFADGRWQGLKQNPDPNFFETIFTHKMFMPRSVAEHDPEFKQIIPYLVFQYQDKYFLMQRQAKASEARLQSKYSFGIGGHIREEDSAGTDIAAWADREFHEEVLYTGNIKIQPFGVLNDDSDEVGTVHLGCVYILEGDSPAIKVHTELASGRLLRLSECQPCHERMEKWSQIVFHALKDRERNQK